MSALPAGRAVHDADGTCARNELCTTAEKARRKAYLQTRRSHIQVLGFLNNRCDVHVCRASDTNITSTGCPRFLPRSHYRFVLFASSLVFAFLTPARLLAPGLFVIPLLTRKPFPTCHPARPPTCPFPNSSPGISDTSNALEGSTARPPI